MCFQIDPRYKEVLIAKRPIIVYKRFRGEINVESNKCYMSPYQMFIYEKGETYFEDAAFVDKCSFFGISIGLHSYSALDMAKYQRANSEIIVPCVIPKGSKYYYNSIRKEYISDTLTIGTKSVR